MDGSRMNTVPSYHTNSFGFISFQHGWRIDTEEVDGSSPFGPTILFNLKPRKSCSCRLEVRKELVEQERALSVPIPPAKYLPCKRISDEGSCVPVDGAG